MLQCDFATRNCSELVQQPFINTLVVIKDLKHSLLDNNVEVRVRHGTSLYATFSDPKSLKAMRDVYRKKIKDNPRSNSFDLSFYDRINEATDSDGNMFHISVAGKFRLPKYKRSMVS